MDKMYLLGVDVGTTSIKVVIIDENAKLCGGSLATPLEIYMDEWAQLRRNP